MRLQIGFPYQTNIEEKRHTGETAQQKNTKKPHSKWLKWIKHKLPGSRTATAVKSSLFQTPLFNEK